VFLQIAAPPATAAQVIVFDAAGWVVRNVWAGALSGQMLTVSWDGRDAAGRKAPAGIYLVKVTTSAGETSGRVVLTQ
jgi:flagellar hook assembly protein FlgD